MLKRTAILIVVGAAFTILAGPAEARSVQLKATLTGQAEVPDGAPNGRGTATVTLNDSTRMVCWRFRRLSGLGGSPQAAHIHLGRQGVAGDVVVPFGERYRATGCVSAPRGLIRAIMARPARYYVNVHNTAYPAGAVRGQLEAPRAALTLRATVGGGADGNAFTIALERNGRPVRSLAAGTYRLIVRDLATIHNFHLSGPGVNRSTSVSGTGTVTWTVRLRLGTYRYVCDPHAGSMRGSVQVR